MNVLKTPSWLCTIMPNVNAYNDVCFNFLSMAFVSFRNQIALLALNGIHVLALLLS